MYTYTTFQKALAIEMAVPNNDPTDPQFVAIVPTLIDQAEQRIYRELDLLAATSAQSIPGAPGQALDISAASPQLLIVEGVAVILPAGETNPLVSEIVQLFPVSRDWIWMTYGVTSARGQPKYFVMANDRDIAFGPTPDLAYSFWVTGKYRPMPLYDAPPGDGTQTTFLASLLPDLFLAAAMCAATGYQHNWGAQADDPRSAMSWETTYQGLLGPARGEEMRKKYHGWMGMTAEINAAPSQPGTPGPA